MPVFTYVLWMGNGKWKQRKLRFVLMRQSTLLSVFRCRLILYFTARFDYRNLTWKWYQQNGLKMTASSYWHDWMTYLATLVCVCACVCVFACGDQQNSGWDNVVFQASSQRAGTNQPADFCHLHYWAVATLTLTSKRFSPGRAHKANARGHLMTRQQRGLYTRVSMMSRDTVNGNIWQEKGKFGVLAEDVIWHAYPYLRKTRTLGSSLS